jgi:fructoselysine-6-P-deglycase FrlB-like protein
VFIICKEVRWLNSDQFREAQLRHGPECIDQPVTVAIC